VVEKCYDRNNFVFLGGVIVGCLPMAEKVSEKLCRLWDCRFSVSRILNYFGRVYAFYHEFQSVISFSVRLYHTLCENAGSGLGPF
jgi:hypothetical protein